MTLEVKRRSYYEINTILENRHDLILKNNPIVASLIEEILEYSFYLSDAMNALFHEESKQTGKILEGPKSLIPILYDRNNHYIMASYKLAMLGLNNPSNSIMRVVFEGITQIYLLHLTTKEAELFYKKQLDLLTDPEKEVWKTTYRYLPPRMVRNILYCEPKKTQMTDFYTVLSNTSHPSIIGAIGDIELKDEIVMDTLSGILALGISNIIAFNEIYSDKYNTKTIYAINNLLDKVTNQMKDQMIDIVPNNPSFQYLRIVLSFSMKSTDIGYRLG